jgi:DNA-binding NtrC family response regulator
MPVVLLVEDDPHVRKVIETALAERGLEVHAAVDERTAQRVLDREADRIRVLVADVNLGVGATGFDVARKARRLNPRVEVVYITGQALNVQRFGVEGGVLFPKPFNLDQLADMVVTLTGPA